MAQPRTPPDLTDPEVRAAAVRAAARQLVMSTALCPDRARGIAGRMIDDAVAAATAQQGGPDDDEGT